MNRSKVMIIFYKEIDKNDKLATKSLKEKNVTEANKYLYANERLIELGKNINSILWE